MCGEGLARMHNIIDSPQLSSASTVYVNKFGEDDNLQFIEKRKHSFITYTCLRAFAPRVAAHNKIRLQQFRAVPNL